MYILFRRGKYIDVKILALNIKTKIHYIFSMFNVSQKLSVFVENFLRIRLGNSQGIVGNWSWIKLKRRLYIPAKLKLGLQESLNVKERKKTDACYDSSIYRPEGNGKVYLSEPLFTSCAKTFPESYLFALSSCLYWWQWFFIQKLAWKLYINKTRLLGAYILVKNLYLFFVRFNKRNPGQTYLHQSA